MHAASHCGRFLRESARRRCAGSVSPAASHVSQKRDAAPTGGEPAELERDSGVRVVLSRGNAALRAAPSRYSEGLRAQKSDRSPRGTLKRCISTVDGTLFANSSRGTRELGKYPRGTRSNHQQKHWH